MCVRMYYVHKQHLAQRNFVGKIGLILLILPCFCFSLSYLDISGRRYGDGGPRNSTSPLNTTFLASPHPLSFSLSVCLVSSAVHNGVVPNKHAGDTRT